MKYKAYPEYKDSGIEWIGEIPKNWEVKKLKYLCSVNDDTLSETTSPDLTMRYVEIGSVTFENGINEYQELIFENSPSRARRKVKQGDVIVSTVRTYLKAVAKIVDDTDVIVSTGFAVIRPRKILPEYLSYLVRTPYFVETVSSKSVGVSYPAINASEMMNIEILIPTENEQTAIASFLDKETGRISSIIEAKTKLIEKLKEKRIAVISHAVTKGLDPNVKLKPSGIEWIGDIPEGWEVKKLKYIGKAIIGLTYSPDQIVSDEQQGVLVFRSSNVQNGRISYNDNVYVDADIPLKLRTKIGDILICSRNGSKALIGKNAIITEKDKNRTFGAFMTIFRSKYYRFLYYVFNSTLFEFQADSCMTTTVNQLTTGNLNNMGIPLPPLDQQKAIAECLDAETTKIDSIIAKTQTSIDKLNEYKTAIISAAVTGKIDVRGEVNG